MLLDFASQTFSDSRSFQMDFCSHYSGAFGFSALPALPALPALRSFLPFARFWPDLPCLLLACC